MSGRIQILQIEASRETGDRIESALGKAGFATDCLRVSTRAALDEAVKDRSFDIALADTAVSGLTAPVALRLIHAARPELPVIALTASLGTASSAFLFRSGAADVVAADDSARLVGAVRRILKAGHARSTGRPNRSASASYRLLFDSVGDIALASDISGNIIDTNDIASVRLGYDQRRLSAMTLFDLDPETTREKLAADIDRVRREGLSISERHWLAAGGVPVPVAVTMRLIKDRGRPLLLHLGRDLSQRHWAEQVFRESEERFRRIFEDAAAGIVLVAPDFRFLKANDGFCRFIGYREEELVNLTFQDVTFPEDRPIGGDLVRSVLAGERKSFQLEKRYLRRDGKVVWGLVSSSLLRETAGAPLYFVTQVFNITERKRAENELRESEERHRILLDGFPCVALLLRPSNREIIASNKAAERIGAVAGSRCHEQWFKRPGACPWCQIPEILNAGDHKQVTVETDGRVWDAHWILVAEDLVMHYAFDITEQVQAKKALREIEERFQFTMDAVNVAVLDWDIPAGRMMFSQALPKIIGEASLPQAYAAWESRLHPEEKEAVLQSLAAHLSGATDDWICDHQLRTHDDGWVWVVGQGRVVARDAAGHAQRMVGTLTDITERKQAEQALREREGDLRRLSARLIQVREEERNRIARNIHDDLGHAVMTIKMNLFLADMTLAAGANPVREIVKDMKDQVDALLETIQRISMEIRPAVLYDLGLVEALQFYVKRFEEQTKIACRMHTAPGIPDLPEETAITVYRIVQEVFVNMFRHSGCTEITLEMTAAEGRFRLVIADNGKGIAREKIGSLDSLGIIGMRERALSLDGDFTIAGEPGKGTVVTMSFPLPERGARG